MLEVSLRGLTFSKLTLGTVQLGIPYGIANKNGKPDDSTSAAILETALAGGINCLDTANTYGNSEQVLGRFFRNREKPLLVTKMHVKADANATAADVERLMVECAESSLENLQLPVIPVMMLHNPEIMDRHAAAVTAAAKRLVRDGYTERMGLSFRVQSKPQFDALWRTVSDDVYEAVQIPINILDTRLLTSGCLNMLAETGKMVFARSIFLQGLLFMRDEELPGALQDAAGPLRVLRSVAAREGMSVAQLAMSFIRDLPEIHSIVFGAETPGQVRENLELFHGPAISEAGLAEILSKLSDMPEHIVDPVLWPTAK